MSANDSNEESSSNGTPPDFEEYLGFEKYIPHKIKLIKSNNENYNEKNEDNNNFINSTLYCLTNLKYFLVYLYKCHDLESKPFKALNQAIKSIYDNIKEDKKECNSFFFNKFIMNNINLFKNELYKNPRILIDCILNKFFLMNNSINLSSIKSNLSIINANLSSIKQNTPSTESESLNSNERSIFYLNQLSLDNTSSESEINFSVKESYGIEQNTYIEDKISIVIKKTRKCSNINCGETKTIYKNMTTLHFNLKDNNKEYSLYDCFDEFLKKEKENDEKGKCSICSKGKICVEDIKFYKFPESIIIFIYYGEEKDQDEFKHFYYNFEEILDFSNINSRFVDDNLKNEKYFLSSLIACKFPKVKKDPNKDVRESFYTFCRGDKDSKYVVYTEELILDNRNVKNKVKKLKTNELDPKKSYPFVLVYTSIKDKNMK